MLYGALEAGGTKMVCALGDENGKILEQTSIKTTVPQETLPQIAEYFKDKDIKALGIACFGPIDLNRDSKTYGYITSTPKTPWINCDIVGYLKKELNVPIGFDTDVNGSLLGEVTYGDSKGLSDVVYFTIGTGIGAGIMSNGKLLHGMLHPEAGHMIMARVEGDDYKGHCPFHESCFEGMASGPAIEERWGRKAIDLSDTDEVWELEAEYISQALMNIVCVLSPKRIILGGGVMHQMQIFELVRKKLKEKLNDYIKAKELYDLESYIVPASLHDDQGIMGCIKLAIDSVGNG
ncbi:MAG: ROK family protein [Lachnospiraceae bacterium]|nr:ROK family protein [Lachnospiraceae bacterium]